MFGIHNFLPNNMIMRLLARTICKTPVKIVCDDIFFLIAGFDTENFNQVGFVLSTIPLSETIMQWSII